jgi:probable HAF family extracellular repeat protein
MYRYLIVPVVLALGLAAAAAGPAAASKSSPKPTPTPTPSPTFPYTMTDLGSLGYGVTYGLAINANGQVTGYSYSSQEFQVTCPPQKYGQPKQCFEHPYHAFLYSNGTMTDLGTLGGHFSKGYAINASGEIVGQADTKTVGDSFLWNGTSMADIGFWDARGINDSGEIAGICGNDPGEHACAYNNGTLTELPQPTWFTPINCGGGPINKSGEVVGTCDDTSSNTHAVLWENGTPTDLGSQASNAADINNLGQVVGNAETSAPAEFGYLWSNGTMTDLGPNFFPNAINDNGVVVGGPMIYRGGTLQNLNNLIPPGSGFTLDNATAINDNGQIVVNGYNAQGQEHAFRLNPS